MWVTRRAGAERRTAEPLTRLGCGGYPGRFQSDGGHTIRHHRQASSPSRRSTAAHPRARANDARHQRYQPTCDRPALPAFCWPRRRPCFLAHKNARRASADRTLASPVFRKTAGSSSRPPPEKVVQKNPATARRDPPLRDPPRADPKAGPGGESQKMRRPRSPRPISYRERPPADTATRFLNSDPAAPSRADDDQDREPLDAPVSAERGGEGG